GRARPRGGRGARGAGSFDGGGAMNTPLRVLVVDDERLFAELMRVALGSAQDMQVVDVVHDVAGAVAATARLRPDVGLSAYHLPDGTAADVARSVRRAAPEASVLVLTCAASSPVLADVPR